MKRDNFDYLSSNIVFSADWLNLKLENFESVTKFFSLLESLSPRLARFTWERAETGIYNYTNRYRWHGMNGFQFAFNPHDCAFEHAITAENTGLSSGNFGIFVTIAGSAIRELENLETDKNVFNELMYMLWKNGAQATRYDVCADFFDPELIPLDLLSQCFENFYKPQVGQPAFSTNYFRRPECKNVVWFPETSLDLEEYTNYQIGGHGSRTGMCRVYNKYDEQRKKLSSDGFSELQEKSGFSDFWYRIECELHKERANQAFQNCMKAFESDKKKFNLSGLWLNSLLLFFKVVDIEKVACTMSLQPSNAVWVDFVALIESIIHFVYLTKEDFAFARLPYVRESAKRCIENLERLMVFF